MNLFRGKVSTRFRRSCNPNYGHGGGRAGRNAGVGIAAEGQAGGDPAAERAAKAALLRQLMGANAPNDARRSP